MKLSKKIARKIVFPFFMSTGLDKPLRNLSTNSVLNIMYHGVVPVTNPSFSPRHLSVQQFEEQLKYFTRNFEILSLPEAFEYHRNKQKPKRKSITISFDDGYRNNLYHALPLLEKYNIKTTFFISGVCADDSEVKVLWADIIACLNYFHKKEVIKIDNYKFYDSKELYSGIKLSDFIKSQQPKTRDQILQELMDKYQLDKRLKEIPNDYWELLNKDELKSLTSSTLVDIGSHGYLHYNLGVIGIKDTAAELKRSKELLQDVCERKIDMIAYPDGSYNAEVKDLAEEIGYDKQLAVNFRLDDDKNDPRILGRHGISPNTTFESNMLFLNKAFHSQGFN